MASMLLKSNVLVVPTRASASKAAVAPRVSFKATVAPLKSMVSNASTSSDFQVWQPVNNKFFETFSYLPPLSDTAIAKQVDYIVGNGWTPAIEFASAETAYIADVATVRLTNGVATGYYDNRYWALWKLPLFGCTDASQSEHSSSHSRQVSGMSTFSWWRHLRPNSYGRDQRITRRYKSRAMGEELSKGSRGLA
jgi:ribulose-bisphosphate carboxylase small chain